MDKDHVGPDPTAWVDRLIEVAKGSSFKPLEIYNIVSGLHKIKARLEGLEVLCEKAGISPKT